MVTRRTENSEMPPHTSRPMPARIRNSTKNAFRRLILGLTLCIASPLRPGEPPTNITDAPGHFLRPVWIVCR